MNFSTLEVVGEPSLILATVDDLRHALTNELWWDQVNHGTVDKWRIKSEWLCTFIESRTELVYNCDFMRAVETELSLPRFNDSGSPLSLLVYNARRFIYRDKLIREGYFGLTQEKIDEALANGQRLKMTDGTVLTARHVNGKTYAFAQHKRNWFVVPQNQPVKFV